MEKLKAELAPAQVICANRFDIPRIANALQCADVAFLSGDLDERFLRAPGLKWVHCDHAGLERSSFPEVFERNLLVTSAAGRSAPALAEHAMFFMLALSFRYARFYDAQRERRWGVQGQNDLRALRGQTLGIVGLGHTGTELASYAKAFGMRVVAYRRCSEKPPQVDHLYSADRGDSLIPLLQQSNFVVLAISLSDQTYHLIGSREIALMGPGSHLINMARGGLIDEQALVDALYAGRLAGAAIDVAEEEPLSRKSLLWDVPNLLITPHVTPQLSDRGDRALHILLDNIHRYRKGIPLLNQLTRSDIFSQSSPAAVVQSRGGRFKARIRHLGRRIAHRWRIR